MKRKRKKEKGKKWIYDTIYHIPQTKNADFRDFMLRLSGHGDRWRMVLRGFFFLLFWIFGEILSSYVDMYTRCTVVDKSTTNLWFWGGS